MKLVRTVIVTAMAASFSTAAMAGGFEYESAGGSFGKWSYADAVSSGTAECKSYTGCTSNTYGGAETVTTTNHVKYDYGHSGFGTTTTSLASGGNISTFDGAGHAQSHTASYAGSGTGFGLGFKTGSFTPDDPKPKH